MPARPTPTPPAPGGYRSPVQKLADLQLRIQELEAELRASHEETNTLRVRLQEQPLLKDHDEEELTDLKDHDELGDLSSLPQNAPPRIPGERRGSVGSASSLLSGSDLSISEEEAESLARFWPRACWLVGLLLVQSVSSFILKAFHDMIETHPSIVYFLTMLVGAGGRHEKMRMLLTGEVVSGLRFVTSRSPHSPHRMIRREREETTSLHVHVGSFDDRYHKTRM